MSEPAKALNLNDDSDSSFEHTDEELSTNRLSSGYLEGRPPLYLVSSKSEASDNQAGDQSQIDWVTRLSTKGMIVGHLDNEPLREEPQSSGMSQHAAPPRMVPTMGARISSGLRRTTLLAILAAFAVGTLAAGAYALATSSWLSTLTQPQPMIPPPNVDGNPQPPIQGQPPAGSQPSTGAGAGVPQGDARQLRDQGLEHLRKGNLNEAIDLLEIAVGMSGEDAITHYQLGLAYLAVQGREHSLDDAQMAFRTAASLQPTWAAPHQGLAESLIRQGFYKEAVEPALTATRLDPNLAEAWMTLGRAYQGAGMKSEATAAFAEAARRSPAPPQP